MVHQLRPALSSLGLLVLIEGEEVAAADTHRNPRPEGWILRDVLVHYRMAFVVSIAGHLLLHIGCELGRVACPRTSCNSGSNDDSRALSNDDIHECSRTLRPV